jgi:hypothetical protein
MKTVLKYFLRVFAVLVVACVVFTIYVATRPADFVITRSAVVPAPADRVFALVNDFHRWNDWSPWAKIDPNCKTKVDGPPSGVGAKFAWDGNNQVGSGSMAITESRPNDEIKIDLTFTRPMQATNLTVFTFKPEASGTRVTWTMSGVNGFVGKLFGVFMDCDKMVGGDFEKGFDNMKEVLAAQPK